MYLHGLFAGLSALIIIGLFHPVVIKGEYHFGKCIWPFFLITGLGLITAACIISHVYLSIFLGITGFSCIWTIKELFDQEKRVERGWFPRKPAREPAREPGQENKDQPISPSGVVPV